MHTNTSDQRFPPAPGAGPSRKQFKVGTLTYTVSGLAVLFFWLLWGDFCFTLMEVVWQSILPLHIKALNAPNWVIGAMMTSIPQILNMTLNPVISTKSDSFRSQWGRRRPFMLVATPFIALFLCLVGFTPEMGRFLFTIGLGKVTGWSVGAITVGVIAVMIAGFRIAELFVATLFYYFLNDVVPQLVMARFLALFRVVGTLAGALYSFFFYQHALTHMRLIFVCAGLLYFVGFMMMCWRVKEGEYPPPSPVPDKDRGFLGMIRVYVRDCFGQKLFIILYLQTMVGALTYGCAVFGVFLNISLGLNLQQLGSINAMVNVFSTLLIYPAGMLADRFHPMRLIVLAKFAGAILIPLQFVWLFTHYSPSVNYMILLVLNMLTLPLNLIVAASIMPLYMRLFPREQFGKYCSCIAMCGALVGIFSGILAGLFIDNMRKVFPDAQFGKDFCFRLIPAWNLFFMSVEIILLALFYKEWRRLGGVSYVPHAVEGNS